MTENRRTNVILSGRSDRALKMAMELSGDTQTNTLNRAVQVLAYFLHRTSQGAVVRVHDPDGNIETVNLTI